VHIGPRTADEKGVFSLLLLGAVLWMALALPVALIIGRSVRLADQRAARQGSDAVLTTAAFAGVH
jgi:hypothetical protein